MSDNQFESIDFHKIPDHWSLAWTKNSLKTPIGVHLNEAAGNTKLVQQLSHVYKTLIEFTTVPWLLTLLGGASIGNSQAVIQQFTTSESLVVIPRYW